MNQSNHRGFSIQQVADMTGLSKQVIRKWEERYGIVQPKRLSNGYRIFSEEDIKTYLKVKQLSENGHSLKQAALLVKEEEDTEVEFINSDISPDVSEFNEYFLRLLEKGSHCDELGLNRILKQAYHHLGLDRFLTNLVIPFLKEVGRKWETKEWSEYQESVSSLVVRDFLVEIRRNYQYSDTAPFVLGACLPNEHHEVPLHIILLRFIMKGWRAQLIGASPAPGSIESIVSKLKPDIVLLSASTTNPFQKDPNLLERLDEFAKKHKDITFYLGGQGAIIHPFDYTPTAIRITNSIEDILGV